jgi:hypothetical protein
MDPRLSAPPAFTADAARLYVQSLSNGGREALLRALLEQYEQAAHNPGMSLAFPSTEVSDSVLTS